MDSALVHLGLGSVASALSRLRGSVGTHSPGQGLHWAPSPHGQRGTKRKQSPEEDRDGLGGVSCLHSDVDAGSSQRPSPPASAPALCPACRASVLQASRVLVITGQGDRHQVANGSASWREKNYVLGAVKCVRKPSLSSVPARLVQSSAPELGATRRTRGSQSSRSPVTANSPIPISGTRRGPCGSITLASQDRIRADGGLTSHLHATPCLSECRAQPHPQISQSPRPSSF